MITTKKQLKEVQISTETMDVYRIANVIWGLGNPEETASDSFARPSNSSAHSSRLYKMILEKTNHQKPDWVQWDETTTPMDLLHWINNPTDPRPVNCHAAVAMCLYLLGKIEKKPMLKAALSYENLLEILGIGKRSRTRALPLPLYDQLPAYAVVIFDDDDPNLHLGLASGGGKVIHLCL